MHALLKLAQRLPENLRKAHRVLDAAVDAAYALGGGKKTWKLEAERVAYLFTLYEKLTTLKTH
jgi:hypothetical protein